MSSSLVLEDDFDPITNPFYYAQNMEEHYESEFQKLQKELDEKKTNESTKNNDENSHKEITLNKKKRTSLSLKKDLINKPSTSKSSYVIRKEKEKALHLIKISIQNLNNANIHEIDTENPCVSVQYIVTDIYDSVMDDTENLINKIVKKLSAVH